MFLAEYEDVATVPVTALIESVDGPCVGLRCLMANSSVAWSLSVTVMMSVIVDSGLEVGEGGSQARSAAGSFGISVSSLSLMRQRMAEFEAGDNDAEGNLVRCGHKQSRISNPFEKNWS